MTVLIAGNSHVACMLQALRGHAARARPDLDARRLRPRFWEVDGTELFFTGINRDSLSPGMLGDVADGRLTFADPEVADEMRHWTGSPDVSAQDVWGLCTVSNTARKLLRDPWWAGYSPSRWAAGDRQPLTDDVLRRMIEHDQRGIRQLFDALRDRSVPVLAIAGPPPRHDHPLAVHGLTAEAVVHVDAVARSTWREWLGDRGIPLVEPPPEVADTNGFLRPELHHVRDDGTPDRHHANEDYGAAMVRQVALHAGRFRADERTPVAH